jgi:hypothetical protein
MLGDIQRQAGLSHRWTGAENDEVGRLQSGRHLVQIVKARGDARDVAFMFGQIVDVLEGMADEVLDAREILSAFELGGFQDQAFGLVQHFGEGA